MEDVGAFRLAAGLLSLLLLMRGEGESKSVLSAPTAEQKWREILRALSTVGFEAALCFL